MDKRDFLRTAVPWACPRGWVQELAADIGVNGHCGQAQGATVRSE